MLKPVALRRRIGGGHAAWRCLLPTILALLSGCDDGTRLHADLPLHLEDHIAIATVVGAEAPTEAPGSVGWHFDEPQSDWSAVEYPRGPVEPTGIAYVGDAMRLNLTEEHRVRATRLLGFVAVDLPDYDFGDWGTVLVRARTSDMVGTLHVGFNIYETEASGNGLAATAWSGSGAGRVVGDGSVQMYAFRIDYVDMGGRGPSGVAARTLDEPMRQIALRIFADEPSSIEILSVTLAPASAAYPLPAGVQTVSFDNGLHYRTLYSRAPGRIDFPVEVPEGGRLDVGLAEVGEAGTVTFRVVATPERGEPEVLLEEALGGDPVPATRSVDLAHLAGRVVTLSLQADAEREGAIALWAAPTLTGVPVTDMPNVVLYVIDGGSSDHMSAYGYNRRTTPNLERLAAEGALFENAYSNATHTEASTPSFVTSLHTSVILGEPEGDAVVPEQGVSMAERLHAIGYQTALLTDNPNAGQWAGVERGADMFGDAFPLDVPAVTSSARLHDHFWRWRQQYPGEPYLIHFQTTDVHRPWASVPPFAGLFLPAELRRAAIEREDRLGELLEGGGRTVAAYERLGIDVSAHLSDVTALYDEAMAEQDFMLGQLVDRLKAEGEWEKTLLVVAADHGAWAGGLRDPRHNQYDPMLRGAVTRIPLLFVWPGRIPGGQRFEEPVSMIDVLPTVLHLVGVPPPEIAQGQSLAHLMLGVQGWEPRPVILDEFVLDAATGEPTGVIEVIDGRWGASLHVNASATTSIGSRRSTPLLLYDLWEDPYLQRSLHDERRDLAAHYTAYLESQLEAHRALAGFFTSRPGPNPLTPEQLERLRTLGYIR